MNAPTSPPTPQIAVVGSLNMDIVVRVPRAPEAGETLLAHELFTTPGGKGANQAVACARLGARVAMVGCVGRDDFGQQLREVLRADGVDTSHVRIAGSTSGVAVILVDDAAENRIVIVPGANAAISTDDVHAAHALLESAAMTVLQLEIPVDVVVAAAALANAAGRKVLFNPAPMRELPDPLWPLVDILVLNETEAAALTGRPVDSIAAAEVVSSELRQRGPTTVILTLGAEGAVLADPSGCRHVAAVKVAAVDTTAAGDTFIGAFAAATVAGLPAGEAVDYAVRAAALCVTRLGAQVSIPFQRELPATTGA